MNIPRLKNKIVDDAKGMSARASKETINKSVAKISDDTILRLLKKNNIENKKEEIKMVCIDDFALKKRHRYGTVMIDIETHQIIDLLESRDEKDVTEWLETYPNIEVISRDGGIVYKSSSDKAHPKAKQISDRFHVLCEVKYYEKLSPKRLYFFDFFILITSHNVKAIGSLSSWLTRNHFYDKISKVIKRRIK